MRNNERYAFTLNDVRIGSIVNYMTEEGIFPNILDWQDLKLLYENPEEFNKYHFPITLTESLMKKIRSVRRPDFKPIEFSMTPPSTRQVDNNYWSNDIHDDTRLHLSPNYRSEKVGQEFVKKSEPDFWFCWICAHGTGSSWFLSLQACGQLKYFHQLQNLYFAITGHNLTFKFES